MTNLENLQLDTNTPLIPESVYQCLPGFLKQCTDDFSGRERDMFLTGLLGALSACLPGVYGTYDRSRTFPNLYVVVLAPPASGKGVLKYVRMLLCRIQETRETSRDSRPAPSLVESLNANTESLDPVMTYSDHQRVYKTLIVPGNASSAGLMATLNANKESVVIFETEIDSLNNSQKQDWGGVDYILRLGFQHEAASSLRKDALIGIDEPRISIVLAGTKEQFNKLVPSCENGLYSRLIIYTFNGQATWRDPSDITTPRLDTKYEELSDSLLKIHNHLAAFPTQIKLNKTQWDRFNNFFRTKVCNNPYPNLDYYTSTLFRMGTITHRIIMLFTAIRKGELFETQEETQVVDVDVESALELAEIYLKHSILYMGELPVNPNEAKDRLTKFYEALPDNKDFTSSEAYVIGWEKCMIKERHVRNHLLELTSSKRGMLEKLKTGLYRKK
jgi:hypothetical protein